MHKWGLTGNCLRALETQKQINIYFSVIQYVDLYVTHGLLCSGKQIIHSLSPVYDENIFFPGGTIFINTFFLPCTEMMLFSPETIPLSRLYKKTKHTKKPALKKCNQILRYMFFCTEQKRVLCKKKCEHEMN